MGEALTTTTIRVCDDYTLAKADDTEANVSAYVRHDVSLYQPNNFLVWKGRRATVLP